MGVFFGGGARKAAVDVPEAVVDVPEAVVDAPEAAVDAPEAVVDAPEAEARGRARGRAKGRAKRSRGTRSPRPELPVGAPTVEAYEGAGE